MTRARHIHAARGRRKGDGDGAGWGTASAEPNFNHGVAVVAHRLYSGVGRVGMQHHDNRDAKKWATRARNGKTLDWRTPGIFQISKLK